MSPYDMLGPEIWATVDAAAEIGRYALYGATAFLGASAIGSIFLMGADSEYRKESVKSPGDA